MAENQLKIKNTLTNKSKGCILWGTYATDRETGVERLVNTWWECDGDSGGGNNEQVPPDGGGEGGQVETTQAIEDYIDDTELDACTKDILNKLKNLGNGDIAEMLKRFSPDGSIYGTKMSTGQVINNNPNVLAQTKMDKNTGVINMVLVRIIFMEKVIQILPQIYLLPLQWHMKLYMPI